MADKVTNNKIVTEIVLSTDSAQEKIIKLNTIASDSTYQLETRIAAKNQQIKIQNELNEKAIKDAEKEVKALKGVDKSTKELDKAKKKLEKTKIQSLKITEKNAKSQRKLESSLKKNTSAFNQLDQATGGWVTRLRALATNPIIFILTAIAGALKLLKEAFTSSEEGQNRWRKALLVLNAALGNLLDLVADVADAVYNFFRTEEDPFKKIGESIRKNVETRLKGLMSLFPDLGRAIKLLFEGEFKEAGKVAADAIGKVALGVDSVTESYEEATKAVKGFIKEQEKELSAAVEVGRMRDEADKIERKLIENRAEKEAGIAQLRLKSRQEEQFGAQERKEALLEAQKLEEALIADEIRYLSLRRDAQILENTFSRSNKENLEKEARAKAAVNERIAARANIARQVQREVTRINGQIRAEERREAKALSDFKRQLASEEEEDTLFRIGREKLERLLALEDLKATEEEKVQLKKDIQAKYDEELAIYNQEQFEKNQEAQFERDEIEIEALQLKGERTLQLETELLERKRDYEISISEGTVNEKLAIEERYNLAIAKLRQESIKGEEAKNRAELDNQLRTAAAGFGLAKELALAKMLLNAPEAISNVWTQAAKKPTIPQVLLHGAIGTASVVGPIYKAIKDMNKVKPKGIASTTSSASPSTPTVGPATASVTEINELSSINASNLGTNTSLSSRAAQEAINNKSSSCGPGVVVFSENRYSSFKNQVQFKENKSTL